MDKNKQTQLTQWLKKQSVLGKKWLILTVCFAFISGLCLVGQAALLAHILHQLIIEQAPKESLILSFMGLVLIILFRAACSWGKEQTGHLAGQAVRQHMRKLVLDQLEALGPVSIQGKPAGTWASLLLEQIEEMQDFFARYIPQMAIAVLIPLIILVAVFPFNWAAGLIFLLSAPLVPFFMALVGLGAADASRKNFKALQRLSGHFYDRLSGLATLRLFDQVQTESAHLELVSNDFRKRTMEVLRLAFLSSAVLEFFTSLSIALTAVYFGFSFIGELNFGHYDAEITLFVGIFVLMLAPEFYQPLRDLGTFYHAKAQAIGAAESLVEFLNANANSAQINGKNHPHKSNIDATPFTPQSISMIAKDLEILSPDGKVLVGPISFELEAGQKVALVGPSGAGKTSLMNGLLGFLPYRGSLKINEIELNQIEIAQWRQHLSWVGQNPQLFHGTIRENIALSQPHASHEMIQQVAERAHAFEFIQHLTDQFEYDIGDRMSGLSVGQSQRIAVARALLQAGQCWLLDEPTASLDRKSEQLVTECLNQAISEKTCLIITHRLDQLSNCDAVWVMDQGKLIQQGTFATLHTEGLFAEMINVMHRSDQHA